MFCNTDVSCVSTGALRTHVKSSADEQTDEKIADTFRKAKETMKRKNTPNSETSALFKRLRQNSSDHEAREEANRKISKAMKKDRIPRVMRGFMTEVFVDISVHNLEVFYAERGESIILYLKCGSAETLLRLKEIVLSGVLLRLLSDVITKFTQTESRIQIVVKAEDYNTTLSYLKFVAGRSVNILQLLFITNGCIFQIHFLPQKDCNLNQKSSFTGFTCCQNKIIFRQTLRLSNASASHFGL